MARSVTAWAPAVALSALLVSAACTARSASDTTACRELDRSIQGKYRRGQDSALSRWSLTVRGCSFEVRENGAFQGGGTYTLQTGDATQGMIIVSNDRGCRDHDLPTAYGYTFRRLVLTLIVASADLCGGRAHDMGGRWLRVPSAAR